MDLAELSTAALPALCRQIGNLHVLCSRALGMLSLKCFCKVQLLILAFLLLF